jgi:hypothetical protein
MQRRTTSIRSRDTTTDNICLSEDPNKVSTRQRDAAKQYGVRNGIYTVTLQLFKTQLRTLRLSRSQAFDIMLLVVMLAALATSVASLTCDANPDPDVCKPGACIPCGDNTFTCVQAEQINDRVKYPLCNTDSGPTARKCADGGPCCIYTCGVAGRNSTAQSNSTSGSSGSSGAACLSAVWIETRYSRYKVYRSDRLATTYCLDGHKDAPCGTRDHILRIEGRYTTYGQACSETDCTMREEMVNGVSKEAGHLLQCTGMLCPTSHNARYGSGMESYAIGRWIDFSMMITRLLAKGTDNVPGQAV